MGQKLRYFLPWKNDCFFLERKKNDCSFVFRGKHNKILMIPYAYDVLNVLPQRSWIFINNKSARFQISGVQNTGSPNNC